MTTPPRPRRVGWWAALFTGALALASCTSLPPRDSHGDTVALAPSASAELVRAATRSTAGAATAARLLHTGSSALDARLALVARARDAIDAQYYLVGNDDTGRRFLRALADAAERGVRVRLLVDDLHTAGLDPLLLGLAAHPGAQVRLFNPFPSGRGGPAQRLLATLPDFGRVNRRMHNKLLLVDAAWAITGGRNMADEYFSRSGDQAFFDFDIIAAGAVVGDLGRIFDSYWNSPHSHGVERIVQGVPAAAARAALHQLTGGPAGPPPLAVPTVDALGGRPVSQELDEGQVQLKPVAADALADAPDKINGGTTVLGQARETDFSSLRHYVSTLMSLTASHLVIVGPYNIPGPAAIERMRRGRERGVRIEMLTNSLLSTDEGLAYTAYRRYRVRMLRIGVELYELSPVLGHRFVRDIAAGRPVLRLHTKCAVIDGRLLFVGSLNFDPRSHEHNTEMGLMLHSPALAADALRLIDRIKQQGAYRVRLAEGGEQVQWFEQGEDGSERPRAEPEVAGWRRFWLELLAPLIPESLL